MQMLCTYIGGSRLYGLDTPASDIDERGIFLNTAVSEIVGLKRHDTEIRKIEAEDKMLWELRHFLALLTNANTQILECVYAPETAFTQLDLRFTSWIRDNRERLINSSRMYGALKGYIFSEGQLAQGKRRGRLGSKRWSAIQTYGFSPANYVQLQRLAWAGTVFYQEGFFPVKIKEHDPTLHTALMDIKQHPEKYTMDDLNQMSIQQEKKLDEAYAQTEVKYTVDAELVDNILLAFYMPLLEEGLPWARI